MSKLKANVIVSMFLIISLPFLTKISIVTPLKVNLIFDLIGLVAVLALMQPKKLEFFSKVNFKQFKDLLKNFKGTSFYLTAFIS